MPQRPTITFAPQIGAPKSAAPAGTVIVFAADGAAIGPAAKSADKASQLQRAFAVSEFSGKAGATVEVFAPESSGIDRLVAIGVGKPAELTEYDWLKLGGIAASQARKSAKVHVVLDLPDRAISASEAADVAAGLLLRSYTFDKYKTKKDDGEGKPQDGGSSERKPASYVIHCADPAAAKTAFEAAEAVVGGVIIARDLVNEPANKLGPVEFAEKAGELAGQGLEVEILTGEQMAELGMHALLGVAQGSDRPARMAVMRWSGGPKDQKPVAFIGKGVVFDTGGVSIKPAAGMEDMKGDMGGAAAVTGLMYALSRRKAKVNVVGLIGLVENMLDGKAQRPGDIVTSMSGQTIEVLNTDAEGRLVLADVLWYCNQRFEPRIMVNLATLTGAVIVALGQDHAGLFSNNDELSERLTKAGLATQEKLWRLPLGAAYDKLIDSKNADMKNIGGRFGGSITAAQFLQRFVKDTPWAHLDIAGTAMGSPTSEISQSWASGFGVRLLDRLVRDFYEDDSAPKAG